MKDQKLNYRPIYSIAPGSVPRCQFELAKDVTPQSIVLWGSDCIRCKATGFFEGSEGRRIISMDCDDDFSTFVDLEAYLLVEEDPRNIFKASELAVGDVVKKVDVENDEIYLCVAMGSNLALVRFYGNDYSQVIIIDEKISGMRVYTVELLDPKDE